MMHFGKANKGSIDEQKDLGVEVYICLQLVARGKGGEEGIWDVCFQSHGRTWKSWDMLQLYITLASLQLRYCAHFWCHTTRRMWFCCRGCRRDSPRCYHQRAMEEKVGQNRKGNRQRKKGNHLMISGYFKKLHNQWSTFKMQNCSEEENELIKLCTARFNNNPLIINFVML